MRVEADKETRANYLIRMYPGGKYCMPFVKIIWQKYLTFSWTKIISFWFRIHTPIVHGNSTTPCILQTFQSFEANKTNPWGLFDGHTSRSRDQRLSGKTSGDRRKSSKMMATLLNSRRIHFAAVWKMYVGPTDTLSKVRVNSTWS